MEHDSSCVLESVSDGQNATENGEHCFDVGIAQNTIKKHQVNFMKGADASTTVVWPQEGVRIKDMNKESHRALYTQVTPIGRV